MAEERVATTYEMPDLVDRHPNLPFRFWSRDEDGYIGEAKYLGGSRFRCGRIVEDDSRNEQRVDFTLVVDSQALRRALRAAGRTRVVVRRWWYDSARSVWVQGPRGFVGRLNGGAISGGILEGEIAASPYEVA